MWKDCIERKMYQMVSSSTQIVEKINEAENEAESD